MIRPGRFLALACASCLGTGAAPAAGVAALKEQPYHRDSSATVVAYSRIIDSRGPYLRLVSGGTNIEILRSDLASRVEVPDAIPPTILGDEDIAPLRAWLSDLRGFSLRYPKSAPLLERQVAAIAAHIGRYDAGEVRLDGDWISRSTFARIEEARRRGLDANDLAEVEKRVFEGSQRDLGLILHDGKWMTRDQIDAVPPDDPTRLSVAIEPLWNGDLQSAKFAVKNLGDLASHQTGEPKVRTERLRSVIRNLFLAEENLTRRTIARAGESREAAIHEKNAAKWQQPNAFGTRRDDIARDSREQAAEIRRDAADGFAASRGELADRIRETEDVAADFQRIKERQVAAILHATVRAVRGRHLSEGEFLPLPADTRGG